MPPFENEVSARRVWPVSALCRALADTLDARFNPVRVSGELASFTRASSGHCYFTLKDAQAQLRCAMFKRAASMLDFAPREGELVELTGRLDIYGPRGDLQLIVESMTRQGQGNLFEQFMRLKAKLEAGGLFDGARKRPLIAVPRRIGLVTSLGAAALHDVVTALRRRAQHLQVVLAPSLVQGEGAAANLVNALNSLYALHEDQGLDAILLVRGGGSMEDLWAFNDEALARAIASSPVPLVSGVGHETDFTIADFVADIRAPTPTAAAEMVSPSTEQLSTLVSNQHERLQSVLARVLDRQAQRLDGVAARLSRPSSLVAERGRVLTNWQHRMRHAVLIGLQWKHAGLQKQQERLRPGVGRSLQQQAAAVDQLALRLELLNPQLVLRRGYAMLTDSSGHTVGKTANLQSGDRLRATLADGAVDVLVDRTLPN